MSVYSAVADRSIHGQRWGMAGRLQTASHTCVPLIVPVPTVTLVAPITGLTTHSVANQIAVGELLATVAMPEVTSLVRLGIQVPLIGGMTLHEVVIAEGANINCTGIVAYYMMQTVTAFKTRSLSTTTHALTGLPTPSRPLTR